MKPFQLYVDSQLNVSEVPPLRGSTYRRCYLTHHTRSGWRAEIWVATGVNLTNKVMDIVMPKLLWMTVNITGVRPGEVMLIDHRNRKPTAKNVRLRTAKRSWAYDYIL